MCIENSIKNFEKLFWKQSTELISHTDGTLIS